MTKARDLYWIVQPDPDIAKQIAAEISIPARPEALVRITEEIRKPHADICKISTYISEDVSLAGSILQVVNSAAYGLPRKIIDIPHAASLLGLNKIDKLVNVICLRNQMQKQLKLDRFWDSATEIANISGHLARRLADIASEDAYIFGLFHDCGIPLMMQRYDDYKSILRLVNTSEILPKTKLEDEKYGINHSMVGYHLCSLWNLPADICDGIYLHHHSFDQIALKSNNSNSRVLIAILKAAEQISQEYRSAWRLDVNDEWIQIEAQVTAILGITPSDFIDLKDSMIDCLEQKKEGAKD